MSTDEQKACSFHTLLCPSRREDITPPTRGYYQPAAVCLHRLRRGPRRHMPRCWLPGHPPWLYCPAGLPHSLRALRVQRLPGGPSAPQLSFSFFPDPSSMDCGALLAPWLVCVSPVPPLAAAWQLQVSLISVTPRTPPTPAHSTTRSGITGCSRSSEGKLPVTGLGKPEPSTPSGLRSAHKETRDIRPTPVAVPTPQQEGH